MTFIPPRFGSNQRHNSSQGLPGQGGDFPTLSSNTQPVRPRRELPRPPGHRPGDPLFPVMSSSAPPLGVSATGHTQVSFSNSTTTVQPTPQPPAITMPVRASSDDSATRVRRAAGMSVQQLAQVLRAAEDSPTQRPPEQQPPRRLSAQAMGSRLFAADRSQAGPSFPLTTASAPPPIRRNSADEHLQLEPSPPRYVDEPVSFRPHRLGSLPEEGHSPHAQENVDEATDFFRDLQMHPDEPQPMSQAEQAAIIAQSFERNQRARNQSTREQEAMQRELALERSENLRQYVPPIATGSVEVPRQAVAPLQTVSAPPLERPRSHDYTNLTNETWGALQESLKNKKAEIREISEKLQGKSLHDADYLEILKSLEPIVAKKEILRAEINRRGWANLPDHTLDAKEKDKKAAVESAPYDYYDDLPEGYRPERRATDPGVQASSSRLQEQPLPDRNAVPVRQTTYTNLPFAQGNLPLAPSQPLRPLQTESAPLPLRYIPQAPQNRASNVAVPTNVRQQSYPPVTTRGLPQPGPAVADEQAQMELWRDQNQRRSPSLAPAEYARIQRRMHIPEPTATRQTVSRTVLPLIPEQLRGFYENRSLDQLSDHAINLLNVYRSQPQRQIQIPYSVNTLSNYLATTNAQAVARQTSDREFRHFLRWLGKQVSR